MLLTVDRDCPSQQPAREQHPVNFEALYSEHFAFVWRNLRRLGVSETGLRDAAQDVFLVVYRRLPEFEGRGALQSWLYSIVRRVAAEHRRRRRRKDLAAEENADHLIDGQEPGPEGRSAQNEAVRLLVTLLAGLDEDKRDVLVLVDLEGMAMPEAAAILDLNLNTAYSRLRAARRELREGLRRHRSLEPRQS